MEIVDVEKKHEEELSRIWNWIQNRDGSETRQSYQVTKEEYPFPYIWIEWAAIVDYGDCSLSIQLSK